MNLRSGYTSFEQGSVLASTELHSDTLYTNDQSKQVANTGTMLYHGIKFLQDSEYFCFLFLEAACILLF